MDHEPEPIDHEGRSIDFGRTSIDYEQYRPGFPDGFFDRLASLRWIAPGLRALDLGTGTGTLALGFATRGMATAALDIADELLEVAKTMASRSP